MSKKVKKIVRKIAALGISTIMLVGSTFSATPIYNNVAVTSVAAVSDSDFSYDMNSDGIIIVGYSGSESSIVIPDKINDKIVTGIDFGAFANCTAESIIIPDNVATINGTPEAKYILLFKKGSYIEQYLKQYISYMEDYYSYSGYISPKYISYTEKSDGTLEISEVVFKEQYENIKIPQNIAGKNVTSIGDFAFKYSYCGWFQLPDTIKYIGKGAFKNFSCLSYLNIPDGVTEIKDGTFEECGAPVINLPDSVTKIGENAFCNCQNLENIYLPDGITEIGKSAFVGCRNLKSVNIPSSLTVIPEGIFELCSNLDSIYIPDSVTEIGIGAFNSTGLKKVYIPDSVTKIGRSAFGGCSALENVTVSPNVTKLDGYVFCYCSSLKNIEIPESVKSIGEYAFGSCTNLTSIKIGKGVTFINSDAFESCNNLTIYGKIGGYVNSYAESNGINFASSDDIEVTGITISETSLNLIKGSQKKLTASTIPQYANDATVIWSSSDNSVASVSEGTVKAVSVGTAVITASTNNGYVATCTVTVTRPPVLAALISLDKTSVTIEEGKFETLTATVIPDNADDKKVTWTTSNSSIVSVFNGRITAEKVGTATITATTSNGITATCTVQVTPRIVQALGITLDKTSITLETSQSETITASFVPSDTTDKTITWTTSDSNVATVSGGKITAVDEGWATITATTSNGCTATCRVQVIKIIYATDINLSKTEITIDKGQSETITASIVPDDVTSKIITWITSDNNVATVSAGKITAVGIGTATITAETTNGIQSTCQVTVTKPIVYAQGINLNKKSLTMVKGNSEKIKATVVPADADDKTITWETSNSNVAKVSNGTITAINEGTAVITAKTSNNIVASCTVSVSNSAVNATSISLDKTEMTILTGDEKTLQVYFTPANATDSIIWTTSNSNVVSVSDGIVTALNAGTATIVAQTKNNIMAVCNVTVINPIVYPTKITMSKSSLSIEKDDSETLTATVIPYNATYKEIIWTTNNSFVAKVSDGKVTAVGEGSAVITAQTSNGVSSSCYVTVIKPTVITLDKTELTFKKGNDGVKLEAKVSPNPKTITWETSNSKVAIVSEDGTVTPVNVGTAKITAKTSNGKTAICNITVLEQDPYDIKIWEKYYDIEIEQDEKWLSDMELGPDEEDELLGTVDTGYILKKYKGNSTNVVIPKQLYGWNNSKYEFNSYPSEPPGGYYCGLAIYPGYNYMPVTVSSSAFSDCSQVKKITIEEFTYPPYIRNCPSLTTVVLPYSSYLYKMAGHIRNCPNFSKVEFVYSDFDYVEIDGVWFKKLDNDKLELIWCLPNKKGAYSIPNNVTSIKGSAFSGCTELTSITIPNSVTSIGSYAFSGCTGLTNINLPDGITNLESSYIFSGCTRLTSITIPNNVTSIGSYVFSDCTGLRTIYIPDSVTYISYPNFSDNLKIICNKDNRVYYSYKSICVSPNEESKLNYSSISLGESVILTVKTSNPFSTSYKYWVRYKAVNDDNWITLQEYSENSKIIITPDKISEYQVEVYAKEEHGLVTCTPLTFNVSSKFNNTSVLSSESIFLGKAVSIKCSANGGFTPYSFAVYYKSTANSSWNTIQNFSTNENVNLKPAKAGTYDICVKTKDSHNTILKKYFTLTVINNLKSKSSISASEIKYGNSITVRCSATGGTAPYQYAVFYKKPNSSNWGIAQNFSTNANVTMKPATVGNYEICTKIKDSNGTVAKQYMTLTVKANDLASRSSLSATSVNLGNSVTVKCSATGGTAPYQYAVFYKKPNTTNWGTSQNFSNNANVTIKPITVGNYEICTKVKDSNGTVAKQYMTLTVKANDLASRSSLSVTSVNLGSSVTVKCSATGGTAPYQYAIFYKKVENSNWNIAQNFGTNANVTIKPTTNGTYDICAKVKDYKGIVVKQYFKLVVK